MRQATAIDLRFTCAASSLFVIFWLTPALGLVDTIAGADETELIDYLIRQMPLVKVSSNPLRKCVMIFVYQL